MAQLTGKHFLVVLVGVLGVTGVLAGGAMWSGSARSARQSVETEAVGLTATPSKWYDSGEEENVEGHVLTYAYVGPDNRVFTRKIVNVDWYDPAARYKVCFNPADGDDSALRPGDHRCGE
jgi:hypothetical protein